MKNDEARVSDLHKLALEILPVETRRDLLAELQRMLAVMTDPGDIEALTIAVNNVKATLD